MAQIRGHQVIAALYDETAYGVDPSSPDGMKCWFSTISLSPSFEYQDNPIIGAGRGVSRRAPGNESVAGDIVTTISPTNAPFWLKHLLGAPTGSGTNASPYVYVPKDLPVGFLVEYDWRSAVASKVERDRGCRINSGAFSLNQQGFLDFTASIIGQARTSHTTPLDATLTVPAHDAFRGCGGLIKVGGTQVAGFKGGSITVDNGLDATLFTFPGAGQTGCRRYSLPEDQAKVAWTSDLVFENWTLLDLARAATETTIEWSYTNAAGDNIAFLIDHADIDLTGPTIETRAGITLSLAGVGFQSGADMGLKITYKPHA